MTLGGNGAVVQVVSGSMASANSVQHLSPCLLQGNKSSHYVSVHKERADVGVAMGELVRTTDLGFSRSRTFGGVSALRASSTCCGGAAVSKPVISASLLADPAREIVRVCVFYALLQTGVAGRLRSPNQDEDLEGKWIPGWIEDIIGGNKEAEGEKDMMKVRRNWHANRKGALVRKYRVPSKAEGRKLLNVICSLLSDDDSFIDVSTHKGCQIRRENAHAESVCCHNVRALFDELPTPHLVVEITVFPAGPITDALYEKAQKLEKVIERGNSV